MDLVDRKVAALRYELKQLETIAAKRQRCSNDVDEAICLLKNEFMDLRQVLDHFSGIGRKREFWEAFLCSKNEIPRFKDFDTLVSEYAEQLLQDRDLVLKLCMYNLDVYFQLSIALQQDEGIVEALLTSSASKVLEIDDNIQQMYPALVASALERLPLSSPDCQEYAKTRIHQSMWAHRNVALAWASAGGHFFDSFPEEFKDDEELLVAFLQNDGGSRLKPSPRLLTHKQFMLKAVKAHPIYLTKVSNELAGDWDLLLAAMTDPRIALLDLHLLIEGGWVFDEEQNSYEFWINASKTVRKNSMLTTSLSN
jgi:hypothetical protein